MNDTNKCFEHSGDDPVTKIKIQPCKNKKDVCPVNFPELAWINADL